MKQSSKQTERTIRNRRRLILLSALAATMTTVGCSSSKPQVNSPEVSGAKVRPVVLDTAGSKSQTASLTNLKDVVPADKPIRSKLATFKSRDYGVSFLYPWQYAYLSAKTLARDENSQLDVSESSNGKFELARIEIPKGYYPDTNFESGYFSLSLNQDLAQEQCGPASENVKESLETINGTNFSWTESDGTGQGSSAKVRKYIAYANNTCYEIELGVTTQNDRGLAREVNPDHVMRRLDAILRTVTFLPATQDTANQQLHSSVNSEPLPSQN